MHERQGFFFLFSILLLIQTKLLVNIKRKSIKNIDYLTKMSYKQNITCFAQVNAVHGERSWTRIYPLV